MKAKSYYSYLSRFTPFQLRRYQTGMYFDVGRTSMWSHYIQKTARESMGSEDDVSVNYRLPWYVSSFMYRILWVTLAVQVYVYFLIWDGKYTVFNPQERNHWAEEESGLEYLTKYDRLYRICRTETTSD